MTLRSVLSFVVAVTLAGATIGAGQQPPPPKPAPATDLDALMQRALAHRDENWKKIDQYVLDEREDFEARGPGNTLMLGEHREYAWFMRDGVFVRSPVRANGVTISEDDRRAEEQVYLKREKERQAARDRRRAGRGAAPPAADAPPEASNLLSQAREPGFVSTGYFLEFDFEPGNYYVAGRETLNGRQLLKIEYYPTSLFDERQNRRMQQRDQDRNPRQEEIRKQMNKTALVTLWVDPSSADIVKYTFDNLGLDFIPGGWLVRFDDMRATIDMVEPFEGVWLPGSIDIRMALSLATGGYNLRYNLNYYDYKRTEVKSTILPRR